MKKLKIVFAVLGVVLIVTGAALRIFCSFSGKKAEKKENAPKTEVTDILNASTGEEIKKIAQENGFKVLDTESGIEVDGYKLFGYEAFISVTLNSDNSVKEFVCESYPYLTEINNTEEDLKISTEDLKSKSLKTLEKFSGRFNTSYDKFYIIEKPKEGRQNYYDKNSLDSYQAIINGDAWLELSIKDKNGDIWLYREHGDLLFGVIFKLYRTVNSEETKYMNYDIDLSQGNSKG